MMAYLFVGMLVVGIAILLSVFLPRKRFRPDANTNWEQRNDLRRTSLEDPLSAPQSLSDIQVGLGSLNDGDR